MKKTKQDHIDAASKLKYMPAKDHGQRKEMRGYNNPSSHMHGWPIQRRMDSMAYPLIEIFCEHGVGHPMPESVEWCELQQPEGQWGTHGCDGCCNPRGASERATAPQAGARDRERSAPLEEEIEDLRFDLLKATRKHDLETANALLQIIARLEP